MYAKGDRKFKAISWLFKATEKKNQGYIYQFIMACNRIKLLIVWWIYNIQYWSCCFVTSYYRWVFVMSTHYFYAADRDVGAQVLANSCYSTVTIKFTKIKLKTFPDYSNEWDLWFLPKSSNNSIANRFIISKYSLLCRYVNILYKLICYFWLGWSSLMW